MFCLFIILIRTQSFRENLFKTIYTIDSDKYKNIKEKMLLSLFIYFKLTLVYIF